jgi:hypothetical protein
VNEPENFVEILELYNNYEPPINATAVTRKLIDNIPQKYLVGLRRIVITNSSGLLRKELRKKVTARKRKYSVSEVRGFYYHQTGGSPAWIEIFVDKIVEYRVGFFRKLPPLREIALSKVLYHELGHHIHKVLAPEHREQEDVADEWQKKLSSFYVQKKYWYLLPVLLLAAWFNQTKLYKQYEAKILEDVRRRYKSS